MLFAGIGWALRSYKKEWISTPFIFYFLITDLFPFRFHFRKCLCLSHHQNFVHQNLLLYYQKIILLNILKSLHITFVYVFFFIIYFTSSTNSFSFILPSSIKSRFIISSFTLSISLTKSLNVSTVLSFKLYITLKLSHE